MSADEKSQQTPAAVPDRFLARGMSEEASARYVGVSAGTYRKAVEAGLMPRPKRIFGRKLYDRREIDDAFTALAHDGEAEEINDFDDEESL